MGKAEKAEKKQIFYWTMTYFIMQHSSQPSHMKAVDNVYLNIRQFTHC